MENIYLSLEEECKKVGTNLTRVCHKAGVCRSTVQRWKHQEPNTVRIYRKLKAMIDAEAAEIQKRLNKQQDDQA